MPRVQLHRIRQLEFRSINLVAFVVRESILGAWCGAAVFVTKYLLRGYCAMQSPLILNARSCQPLTGEWGPGEWGHPGEWGQVLQSSMRQFCRYRVRSFVTCESDIGRSFFSKPRYQTCLDGCIFLD